MKQSAIKQNANLINLGKGVVWEGGDMKTQGGGHKINLVKEYIKDKRDTDIFIFLDGYDTFLSDTITEIVSRYIGEKIQRLFFSSERYCFPDERIGTLLKELNINQDTPYQYLNSGCYIGRIGRLKELFAEPLENFDDDQLYVQKQYLKNPKGIDLDVEQYIWMTHESKVISKKGQLYNPITRCYGCAYHGNGGRKEKEFCEQLYMEHYGVSSITYIPTKEL